MATLNEVIEKRLALLKRAVEINNIAKACREFDVSRPQFYTYKKRYEAFGLSGLENRPPKAKSNPQRTPGVIEDLVRAIALEWPGKNREFYVSEVMRNGYKISGCTVHRILSQSNIAIPHDRWIRLEELAQATGQELTENQTNFIRKCNPQFQERQNAPCNPATDWLYFEAFFPDLFLKTPMVMDVLIDRYSCYAFAQIRKHSFDHEVTCGFLKNTFQRIHNLGVSTFRVSLNVFYNTSSVLKIANDVGVGIDFQKAGEKNGYILRFKETATNRFLLQKGKRKFKYHAMVDDIAIPFQHWLKEYNQTPQEGFPNYGESPQSRLRSLTKV